MKQLCKAPIAAIVMAAGIACSQTVKAKQEVKPYTIQNDVLGESLTDFQKNQTCILLPAEVDTLEREQTCIADNAHYAGMSVLAKGGTFYQGRLYRVSILATTEQCKKSDLLSMLKEKYGEPKLTETVNGHEITPAVLEGGPPFKIWQNGVATIMFVESFGTLDACNTSFELDEVSSRVAKLKEDEKRKKEEARKKDM